MQRDQKRVAWLTDIHLDFVDGSGVERLCREIAGLYPETVLIGGDVSNAAALSGHLDALARRLRLPIHFVLGNHDFYGGSIAGVRARVEKQARSSRWLNWLTNSGVIRLTERTGLIGHGGWADGRLGTGIHSRVQLNDYLHISEFIRLTQRDRFRQLNTLGDEAADYFEDLLPVALERFSNLLLLTHVPPFKASCWHEGRVSGAEYLPHFACQVVGDVLAQTMKDYPEANLTVLCGHTHSEGEARIAPNLLVKTGKAVYGRPHVQELIIVE